MQEEDYLILSDIHNYAVCPRRWALRTIEDKFNQTWRTIDGTKMHQKAHNSDQIEKRGDTIIMRGLRVVSHSLGIAGECDVVEFIKSDNGVLLNNYMSKYMPFPIEYKRGKAPDDCDCDKLQLCAQAICLEEMLLCNVPCGALFYGEPHRRLNVDITVELRQKVASITAEMHRLIQKGATPKATKGKFCNECSLKNDCIPNLEKKQDATNYIRKRLQED